MRKRSPSGVCAAAPRGSPGRALDPDVGGLIDAGVLGTILFARNIGARGRDGAARPRAEVPRGSSACRLGGPGRRTRGPAARRPLHRAAAHARAGTARGRGPRRAGRSAARARAARHGLRLGLRARAGRGHQPRQPRHRRPELRPGRGRGGAAGRRARARAGGGGVASCGKHFPGHGDTTRTATSRCPVLPHDLERLGPSSWCPSGLRAGGAGLADDGARASSTALGPGRARDHEPRRASRACCARSWASTACSSAMTWR